MGLLNQVRTACKVVAARATHVKINYDRIPSYILTLPLEQIVRPELDPRSHYLGHGNDTVGFLLTLNAINFGSGYFPHLRKRSGMSGYFTIASCLNNRYKERGPLGAEDLTQVTMHECAQIFGQDPRNEPIRELMQLFSTALNDLGRYLLARFGGSFVRLVDAANMSAERLVQILIEMPYFKDVESYYGLRVPFYKRAQITASDLWIAFGGRGPGRFDDLDRLTVFADNLLPHVLRVDGILSYDDNLAARIDGEKLIQAGSPEEIEIRASAVHAMELLTEQLRRSGHGVSARDLDYLLWNRGQQSHYKGIRPRHRTRTVYY